MKRKLLMEFREFDNRLRLNENQNLNAIIGEIKEIKNEIQHIIESDNRPTIIEEGLTDAAVEYIKSVMRSKKAVSAQNKVNKVKYKAAAAEEDDVKKKINDTADELQKVVDDRWNKGDEITKSALLKAKIEGTVKALEIELQNTTAPSRIEQLEKSLKNTEQKLADTEKNIKELQAQNKEAAKEVKDPENKEEVKQIQQQEEEKKTGGQGEPKPTDDKTDGQGEPKPTDDKTGGGKPEPKPTDDKTGGQGEPKPTDDKTGGGKPDPKDPKDKPEDEDDETTTPKK